ncbi:Phosphoadenosine phosphosulfate reductase family-domain-containing protein [Xylaria bambusicola]|uniref:Phosphoadenosine phosphosulfate reductase family-domain-containing protein n=1 Tax=Xylaria bambusicola TaxID=326684 RepID=UPI002007A541|nr:Phosphoadenosine phosphosulfate reductase family-domain-containing protein [Xylaria bambusicola]KAI0522079.1 Phosphoadenosine phosphosulfate reductase family-domain-containing protein [Xylaria bambusicola]
MEIHRYEQPDSGYASRRSSFESFSMPPKVKLTELHLKHLNEQFEKLSPQDILRTSKLLFPNLYQTTAFGLTGLVTLDMLSKFHAETPGASPVEVIFLDTLYHFQETHQLIERVKERYPGIQVHTFLPNGCSTASEFEERYGNKLWEFNSERYDYLAKVEPQQRSYHTLDVAAVLTGRRRSQGAARGNIPIVEMDHERGVVKINPLAQWSFDQVHQYIIDNNVPYNVLLDRGYKSVGDWHSTQPVADGEDERNGRWKGQQKTECGIHNKQSRYAIYLMELAKKQAEEESAVTQEDGTAKSGVPTLSLPNMAVDVTSPALDTTPLMTVEATAAIPGRLRRLPRVTSSGRRIGFSRRSSRPESSCIVQ